MAMAAIGRAARSTGKAPAVFPARIRRVLTSREPKNSRRTDERAFGPAAYAPRWGRDQLRREREAGGCHVLVIARSRNSGNLNAAGGVIPSRALSGGAARTTFDRLPASHGRGGTAAARPVRAAGRCVREVCHARIANKHHRAFAAPVVMGGGAAPRGIGRRRAVGRSPARLARLRSKNGGGGRGGFGRPARQGRAA